MPPENAAAVEESQTTDLDNSSPEVESDPWGDLADSLDADDNLVEGPPAASEEPSAQGAEETEGVAKGSDPNSESPTASDDSTAQSASDTSGAKAEEEPTSAASSDNTSPETSTTETQSSETEWTPEKIQQYWNKRVETLSEYYALTEEEGLNLLDKPHEVIPAAMARMHAAIEANYQQWFAQQFPVFAQQLQTQQQAVQSRDEMFYQNNPEIDALVSSDQTALTSIENFRNTFAALPQNAGKPEAEIDSLVAAAVKAYYKLEAQPVQQPKGKPKPATPRRAPGAAQAVASPPPGSENPFTQLDAELFDEGGTVTY